MTVVQTLRVFNRTWAQRVGVLQDSFLGTGRPLNLNRVVHEVGREGATVKDLRDRLDLDSGYLSRLLAALESDGLAAVEPDAHDRRRRVVRLTTSGEAAYDDLQRRSDEIADRLLAALDDRQRERLDEALRTAELLIRAATVRLVEVGADHPAAREAMQRYVAELAERFPGGFDPGRADDHGSFLVATSDGRRVAYGGVRDADGGAEVKRMWVDPSWRGAGLGVRMLRELEDLARRQGHTRMLLDTNSTLVEAIALYEREGYTRIGRYNDNPYAELFFAKDL